MTAYGSLEYFNRVITNIKKINNAKFLFNHLQFGKVPTILHDVPQNFYDTKKWIFMGCDMRPIRSNCWEYQFHFVYNDQGWNTQHGVTTDMYATFDMVALFSDMDQRDTEDWISRA